MCCARLIPGVFAAEVRDQFQELLRSSEIQYQKVLRTAKQQFFYPDLIDGRPIESSLQ